MNKKRVKYEFKEKQKASNQLLSKPEAYNFIFINAEIMLGKIKQKAHHKKIKLMCRCEYVCVCALHVVDNNVAIKIHSERAKKQTHNLHNHIV